MYIFCGALDRLETCVLKLFVLELHVSCPRSTHERATGPRRVYLRYVKLVASPEPFGPGKPQPPKVPTVHQCVPVHVIGDSPYG
jgi:hypothetical protein